MKIKTKDKYTPETLEVYGIYEISGEIYYYVCPDKYEGLLVMRNDEVEVVDNSINNFVFKQGEYGFLMCSKFIEDDNFRECLSECDPNTFAKFSQLITIKND